jgi:hypothetical protein
VRSDSQQWTFGARSKRSVKRAALGALALRAVRPAASRPRPQLRASPCLRASVVNVSVSSATSVVISATSFLHSATSFVSFVHSVTSSTDHRSR